MNRKLVQVLLAFVVLVTISSEQYAQSLLEEAGGSSKTKIFDDEHLKLFIKSPISSQISSENLILELRECKENQCETVVSRFNLGSIKKSSYFKVSFTNSKWELHHSKPGDRKSLLMAAREINKGWIEPVELCHDDGRALDCEYVLEKDPRQKGIRLRVFRAG